VQPCSGAHTASYPMGTEESVVCRTMGYGLEDRDSIPGRGKIFSLLRSVDTCSGTYPASYQMDTGQLYFFCLFLELLIHYIDFLIDSMVLIILVYIVVH
jgi:hypothetical protein